MKRWPSRENEVSHEASSIRAILMKSLKSSRKPHLAITTFNQAPSLLSHAQLSDVSNHGLSLRPGFSCAGLHRSSCLLHLPALFWQDLVVFSSRTKLREALSSYITETFTHINTVRGFCEKSSRWMLAREEEITQVADIKKRADKIDLLFSHVIRSEKKGETMGEFIDDKWKQLTTDSRPAELEKELAEVLSNTLRGLKKFDLFLAAVEKLAVTSLHVFKENKVVQLPAEINLENVRAVITAARQNCPLLLEFKRDSRVFFFPKLQNVEVLKDQLDRYLQTTRKLLDEILEKSTVIVCLNMRLVVDLSVDLSEDDIEKMLDDIDQLNKIRLLPSLRCVPGGLLCTHLLLHHRLHTRSPTPPGQTSHQPYSSAASIPIHPCLPGFLVGLSALTRWTQTSGWCFCSRVCPVLISSKSSLRGSPGCCSF
ncbi:uncharacterized protein KZ484_003858 isoform 3-T3 [Pholidichthys leucotaenia]